MREPEQAAGLIDRLNPGEDFNFQHFRMRHMVAELLRTGLLPGSSAPDFKLPSTDGPPAQLSDLRGQALGFLESLSIMNGRIDLTAIEAMKAGRS
jgi:hypothetical protein